MTEQLQMAFQQQINRELYSAYLYLDFASRLSDMELTGMSDWMRIQEQEERAHGMHMYEYLLDRCENVRLYPIAAPDLEAVTPLEIFQASLDHERKITGYINELATLAMQENDHSAYQFLQWYINEQVEEESTVRGIVGRLKLVGNDTAMLLQVDESLAGRVFTDPFAGANA